MGSKKKTSSNNDKSPKSNHGSDQHKNGTKPHKQSPKATSSRVKHAEKTKQTEKSKPRTSSAGRWVLIIVISSMVAGGAVLYTCPSVHDFIGELMLKYFHPDILSAVNNFMDATKAGIPSKTGESADAGSKSQPPDEQIVKDKTEPVKSKEQVEQSEKITKKSTEQTQSKHKEKTDHKPEAKTKTNDKPIERETKPKHKEKTDRKPEVKTKPDDKPIEKKTEPKHKEKTDRKPEGKPKPDDKPIEEKTEPKHKEKTDQKSEAKTKPDDKPTKRETQPKHQGKNDQKPETKTKSDDKPVEGESQPKLKDKTDQKQETKTKPDDKPVTKQTHQKTKEKPQDPVSDTKTSKKKETKAKPDDKPVGEQTQSKHKEKQPDPVSGENLNQKEKKSETKRKPEEKLKPKTKPDDKPESEQTPRMNKDKPQEPVTTKIPNKQPETQTKPDKSGSEQTPRTNKDKPQEPVTTKIPNKQPETQTKPDDKPGSEKTPRTNKDKPQEPVTTKIPNKQPETQTKPDDKLKQDNKKSKEQKREAVTKQDGRSQDQPTETKTEQKPKVEKTPKQESQSATDKSTDEQKLKKTKDEEAKSEPAKLKDDAEDKESEESVKEKANSKASITNPADNLIRTSLNEADSLFEEKKYKESLEKFDIILKKYPKSPRALYGKALTLNELAEEYRSNEILEKCIAILTDFLQLDNVPDELYKAAGRKLYDRQQFRGWGGKASKTLLHLCDRFPEDTKLKKELGVSYLMIGRNDPAQAVFENILKMDPTDGFAMVHLGFILKTIREDYDKGIKLLADGIATNHPGTEDGRFYFHLGDALQRKNRTDEAYRYYHIGAAKKLFPSVYQRSMYNVDYLTPRPWWTIEETGYAEYIKLLEDNWEMIRDEGLAQLDPTTGAFLPEDENLREKGSWKQFTLYSQGRKHESACAKAPKTCAVIDKIPDAKGCTRGQTKFSVMKPGVHVWPHCGPTNCRIRAHLGLVIPPGPKIRVIDDTRGWKEGKVIVFDDSFEHEVWHDGNETRLVLIVDFWHPELTADLKKRLPPI